MKVWFTSFVLLLHASQAIAQVDLFPKSGSVDVNPDTRLKLTFSGVPPLNNQGKITIYDASNDAVVDELDMSIPPGPRNTRTPAPYDKFKYSSVPDTVFTVNNPDIDPSHVYQKNYIADMNERNARHFFPVLLDGNTAIIMPHNNHLTYGKTYYVQVDEAVFGIADISGKSSWTFTTKMSPPAADARRLVVSADGAGDFSTFQGAIDAIPDGNTTPKEIYIQTGVYDEMVVLQNKHNLTLHGEDRDKVIVRYANNGVFNGAGRYEFALSGATAVNLVNFTIQSVGKDENPAQAEALYVKSDKVQLHNVTMLGSGDALQIQAGTRLFLSHSSVRGYGDNLLSYGAAFFKNCDMISTFGPHGWPRNPQTNHGDVFVNSTFSLEGDGTSGDGHCELARSPTSGVSFPYAEFVLLNCKLQGIVPQGWGAAGPDYTNVHFWEYNSVNLSDGKPVDVSMRVSYSRQLTMDKDADVIANYSDPSYVLAGWKPELAPILLTQLPKSLAIAVGGSAELSTDAAAEPEPSYQWLKDGQPLPGETRQTLKLDAVTAAMSGGYTVRVANSVGMVVSSQTTVVVGAPGTQPVAGGGSGQGGAGRAGLLAGAGGTGLQTWAQAGNGAVAVPAGGGAQAGAAGLSSLSTGGAAPSQAASVTAGAIAAAQGGAPSQSSSVHHGGCSVGARPRARARWFWLLGTCVGLRWMRRRSRP